MVRRSGGASPLKNQGLGLKSHGPRRSGGVSLLKNQGLGLQSLWAVRGITTAPRLPPSASALSPMAICLFIIAMPAPARPRPRAILRPKIVKSNLALPGDLGRSSQNKNKSKGPISITPFYFLYCHLTHTQAPIPSFPRCSMWPFLLFSP